jgi:hypothetical protein
VKDDFPFMRDKGLIRIVLISMTILVVEMAIDILIRKGLSIELNKWFTLAEGVVFLGIYVGFVFRFKLIPDQKVLSSDILE